jgi:predicted NAD/FAD-binding protein
MSFGITANNGDFEWSGNNLAGVFAQKSNILKPWFYRMLLDIQKFNKYATKCVTNLTHTKITLGQFLDDLNLSPAFLNYYLLPMAGAIWSCPPQQMREFPAKSFLTFFHNHGLLTVTQQPQWYTVHGGSQSYVAKLHHATQNCDTRLKCAVQSVTRSGETVFVTDISGNRQAFDKIVFACSTDIILKILEQPEPHEYEALSKIQFQPNNIILHRDISQMPKRKSAWASWVYQSQKENTTHAIAVTYYMNKLQPFIPQNKPLFVTLNPINKIDPSLIFDTVTLNHPIFTTDTLVAQGKIALLQGYKNCYYAGAWTGYGFHEDGIRSAVQIARLLGIDIH